MPLAWPNERARVAPDEPAWWQAGSNICLDLHGDPARARLAVFSDGNHHMALAECLAVFLAAHPAIEDIFYATTPPGLLLQLTEHGSLRLGNLTITARPHVFLSPAPILERLVRQGRMRQHVPFMQSRGNVLLVRAGNPRAIGDIADLLRPEVRLFLSNPQTEAASYAVYRDTLLGLARAQALDLSGFEKLLAAAPPRLVHGESIHHREAPQAVADDRADAALIYFHLALRYTRIFPGLFEIVPLGGTADDPRPSAANVVTTYHMGLVGDGGKWGGKLLEFLGSEDATAIYRRHGLTRAR
jgi:hypothetical protein